MPDTDLFNLSAIELTRLISTRAVSCVEVLDAHLAQIGCVNSTLNAIVTLVPEHARKLAQAQDAKIANGEPTGPLSGLPVVHKDLFPTAGIRTTHGSRLFKDHVPTENALVVERLLSAGAITIGKSNTPEWGAGSQTFNDVFGATLNPYDTTRTCGGSSGGAAVALAARMVPIADGSDMGGSLRNPANFCNVVGFRPSPGRVPVYPTPMGWFPLGVTGPMARTVSDCALLLSAMAGPDARSPISIDQPGELFRRPLDADMKDLTIAFSADFGGQLPISSEIVRVVASAGPILEALGAKVEDATPDFTDADEIFKTLRAWSFASAHKDYVAHHRDLYKDTIIWNVEQGLRLTGEDLSRAEKLRTSLFHRVRTFMADFDFLVLPVSQVPPFDITTEWVQEIEGVRMETYIDWMKSCYYISTLGLPAISVPCGFTQTGLPVGLQIVGKHHADLAVLKIAHAFEQATLHFKKRPA